jgi:hypothetical protein
MAIAGYHNLVAVFLHQKFKGQQNIWVVVYYQHFLFHAFSFSVSTFVGNGMMNMLAAWYFLGGDERQ